MPKTGPFDKNSDGYDEWFENNRELYLSELEAVRRLIPQNKVEGMEVGVGTGRFAAPLGVKIGVEPSRPMAIKAISRGIQVSIGVAEDLPFYDNIFDFVLMVTTICFLDDIPKSFQETFRVLKPGGCIVIGFVDKDSELGRRYEKKRYKSIFYKEATFFSARQVLTHLTAVGFDTVAIKQTLIPGESPKAIWDDLGHGGFVVMKGVKVGN